MACGEYRLCLWDGANRLNVAILMLIFQTILMCLGAASFSAVVYIFHRFQEFENSGLVFVNWNIVWLMFSMGMIYTIIHFFIFLVCLAITDWKMFFKYQMAWQVIIFFVIIFIIYFAIVIVAAGALLKKYKEDIQTDFLKAFKEFMTQYVKNEEAKVLIDKIQFTYRCCGAESFRDWFATEWVSDEYASAEALAAKRTSKISNVGRTSLPFSCCSLRSMDPCEFVSIEKVPTNESLLQTANSKGCYLHITHYIVYWMDALANLYYGSLALEFVDLIIFRYLQTSMDVAMLYGDPDQTAPGYLCICGAQPMPPGFNLDYEELAQAQQKLQELAYKDDAEALMADVKLTKEDLKLIEREEAMEKAEESEDDEEEDDDEEEEERIERGRRK